MPGSDRDAGPLGAALRRAPMLPHFLRENWLYLVLPIVLVVLGLLALVLFGEDSAADFIYPIH